jgi:4-hydroxybenzoate polyprenyltransferase
MMTAGRQHVRAYLQLVRLPAVFTAMADIVLGFVLAHQTLSPASEFIALLGASTALYLAGMVFNDFFDRALDAEERPNRPIPSGRISPRSAFALGTVLTAIGLVCALAAGGRAIAIAGALTALILAYDGFLKKTVAGPVAMGGCRMLNVLLGASGAELLVWTSPQIGVAAAMGIYVAGLTWFARKEAVHSSRTHLVAATLVIFCGIAGLFMLLFSGWPPAEVDRRAAYALAIVIGFIEFRLVPALNNPTPDNVQAAVKRLLLAIVLFDATMIYWATGSPTLACGTALLVVPAATLGRWIFIT